MGKGLQGRQPKHISYNKAKNSGDQQAQVETEIFMAGWKQKQGTTNPQGVILSTTFIKCNVLGSWCQYSCLIRCDN